MARSAASSAFATCRGGAASPRTATAAPATPTGSTSFIRSSSTAGSASSGSPTSANTDSNQARVRATDAAPLPAYTGWSSRSSGTSSSRSSGSLRTRSTSASTAADVGGRNAGGADSVPGVIPGHLQEPAGR